MDSLGWSLLGLAVATIIGAIIVVAAIIFALSRRYNKQALRRHSASKAFLIALIVSSIIWLVLLVNAVTVGPSIFNNPQFTSGGVASNGLPYTIERIVLGVFTVTTIYLWTGYIRYRRKTKQKNT